MRRSPPDSTRSGGSSTRRCHSRALGGSPPPPPESGCLDRVFIDDLVLPLPYTLTVNKTGTGIATVTSNPAGIDCGATCSTNFTGGTMVTLTATPRAAAYSRAGAAAAAPEREPA